MVTARSTYDAVKATPLMWDGHLVIYAAIHIAAADVSFVTAEVTNVNSSCNSSSIYVPCGPFCLFHGATTTSTFGAIAMACSAPLFSALVSLSASFPLNSECHQPTASHGAARTLFYCLAPLLSTREELVDNQLHSGKFLSLVGQNFGKRMGFVSGSPLDLFIRYAYG